ncbi:hypothetical protein DFH27DRAFT_555066 [Peziza echinospora]|nr:hypothetical protein DFH27DRAFT_555066 [Peziza echinospora]
MSSNSSTEAKCFCGRTASQAKTPLPKLLLCSRCRLISYCGKRCQKYDWGSHKYICKQAPNIYPPKNPDISSHRGLFFPPAEDKDQRPRFVEVAYIRHNDEDGVTWDELKKPPHFSKSWMVRSAEPLPNSTVTEQDLGHRLVVEFKEDGLVDGFSKTNTCVQAFCAWAPHAWAGPLRVMKAKKRSSYWDQEHRYLDMEVSDIPGLVDYFRIYSLNREECLAIVPKYRTQFDYFGSPIKVVERSEAVESNLVYFTDEQKHEESSGSGLDSRNEMDETGGSLQNTLLSEMSGEIDPMTGRVEPRPIQINLHKPATLWHQSILLTSPPPPLSAGSTSRTEARKPQEKDVIHGVTILSNGIISLTNLPKFISTPITNSIDAGGLSTKTFPEWHIAPITILIGLPIRVAQIRFTEDEDPQKVYSAQNRIPQAYTNQSATFLHLDPLSGWAPHAWGIDDVGSVTIAREDEKPLNLEHAEALVQFCQHYIGPLMENWLEDGKTPAVGTRKVDKELTKEGFEMWFKKYRLKKMNKKAEVTETKGESGGELDFGNWISPYDV